MSTVFEQQMNFSNIIFKNERNKNLKCSNCLSCFQFLPFVLLCDGANALCVTLILLSSLRKNNYVNQVYQSAVLNTQEARRTQLLNQRLSKGANTDHVSMSNLAHLHLLNMKLFQNTYFKCYFMFPLGNPLLELVSKM